jgi:branched-chain amino acid transport system permease protein
MMDITPVRKIILTWTGLMLGVAIFVVAPIFMSRFWVHFATEILIMSLFAFSFNLVFGYTGMLSFGQATFFGAGAYTITLLVLKGSVPLPIAFLGGAAVSVIIGAIVGYFCVKLFQFYFAVLTLAFGQLVWAIIWKWRDLTGGDDGVIGIRMIPLLNNPIGFYFFTLSIVVICIAILKMIVNSSFGLMLKTIKDNPERTEFIGINVTKYRLISFILAAFFSGISGMLFALFSRGAFPQWVDWLHSGKPVMAAILGGTGTFFGPLVGTIIITLLDQVIGHLTEYWPFFLGATLVTLVLFLPGGVLGYIQPKFEDFAKRSWGDHAFRDRKPD